MRQKKLRKFINQRFISLLLLSLSVSREALAAQLQLAWVDNSANEDGFKIDRMTGATGAFVPIATVGANVTSYTDPNLSYGTNYCYRVRAFNSAGDSPSVEACKATETLATFIL
ncbi:MAG TPA: fibronectin type III domain-containing protein, partial [Candidatus Nitrosocosmicus sp.]|nr:fibronectin type III domain-containing protein [Candidatus Nitrosocosmicus sp.]